MLEAEVVDDETYEPSVAAPASMSSAPRLAQPQLTDFELVDPHRPQWDDSKAILFQLELPDDLGKLMLACDPFARLCKPSVLSETGRVASLTGPGTGIPTDALDSIKCDPVTQHCTPAAIANALSRSQQAAALSRSLLLEAPQRDASDDAMLPTLPAEAPRDGAVRPPLPADWLSQAERSPPSPAPVLSSRENLLVAALSTLALIGLTWWLFLCQRRRRDGGTRVGQRLVVYEDKVLGQGSHGTVVLEGRMLDGRTGRRKVAAKRMLRSHAEQAQREVRALIKLDDHPNVLRYYLQETHGPFVYLALELAAMTLQQWLERTYQVEAAADEGSGGTIVAAARGLQLVQQTACGVAHLHARGICHADIKPSNVMLASDGAAKLADFGLSTMLSGAALPHSMTSSSSLTSAMWPGLGSRGFTPPERLRPLLHPHEAPPAAAAASDGAEAPHPGAHDIFSLGCVCHLVLCGEHPYKASPLEMDLRIAEHKPPSLLPPSSRGDPRVVGRQAELHQLLGGMLAAEPAARPTADSVLRHPLFWSANARLQLLLKLSDALEASADSSATGGALEAEAAAEGLLPWQSRVPEALLTEAARRRSYDVASARALLRLVRNAWHHRDDLPKAVRAELPRTATSFVRFWGERFPALMVVAWRRGAALGLPAATGRVQGEWEEDDEMESGGLEEEDGEEGEEEGGPEAAARATDDGGDEAGSKKGGGGASHAPVGSAVPERFAQPHQSTELCRSLYCGGGGGGGGGGDGSGGGDGGGDGGGGEVETGCHGARCAFAHAVTDLKATRRRRNPTASHVADQMALWLLRCSPDGVEEASDAGTEGIEVRDAAGAAGLSGKAFADLYKKYCAFARHEQPPHWRPVLLMMQKHRLVEGLDPKAKVLDGWRAGPLLAPHWPRVCQPVVEVENKADNAVVAE